MTATDGHRLAHVERVLSTPAAAPASGIVPSKAAALMERSLMPDEDVLFRLGENDLLVRTDRVTIYARLLEGTFPRYREVIPASHPARMEAAVGELERGVRQAAVLTSDESRAVRFHLGGDRLVLSARTPEAGDARVEVEVSYEGDPLLIGFNPKFIADALAPVEDENVEFYFGTPEEPGLIKDSTGYLCVIMPLNVAEETRLDSGAEPGQEA